MLRRQHRVDLSPTARARLTLLAMDSATDALTRRHARVLLLADEGQPGARPTDAQIAEETGLSARTVARVRAHYATAGLEATLARRPTRRVYERRLNPEQERRLLDLAQTPPPPGSSRWSLRLLAQHAASEGIVASISPETVRATLRANGVSLEAPTDDGAEVT